MDQLVGRCGNGDREKAKCGDDTLKDETTATAFNEANSERKTPLGPQDGGFAQPTFSQTLRGKSQEIKPRLFDGCEKPQILLLSNS